MSTKKKITLLSIAAVLLLIGLWVLGIVLNIFGPRVTAEAVGRTEEIVRTNEGGYRISAYERFYAIEEEIKALDVKLSAYPPAGDMDIRQETECRSLLVNRANLVAEYNSASRSERTIGQWRAADLPEELDHNNPREC